MHLHVQLSVYVERKRGGGGGGYFCPLLFWKADSLAKIFDCRGRRGVGGGGEHRWKAGGGQEREKEAGRMKGDGRANG